MEIRTGTKRIDEKEKKGKQLCSTYYNVSRTRYMLYYNGRCKLKSQTIMQTRTEQLQTKAVIFAEKMYVRPSNES